MRISDWSSDVCSSDLACRGWSRRRTLPAMVVGILVAALAAGVYLHQLSAHTYVTQATGERFAMGTECTADARTVFGDTCPRLGMDALRRDRKSTRLSSSH